MKHIKTKEELAKYIRTLDPSNFENSDLRSYLEAMAAWIEDCEGAYRNNNCPYPNNENLSFFADILTAAGVYE